jgi:hypothetical protein
MQSWAYQKKLVADGLFTKRALKSKRDNLDVVSMLQAFDGPYPRSTGSGE